MDSNFQYAGAVNLVVVPFKPAIARDGSARPSQFSDRPTPGMAAPRLGVGVKRGEERGQVAHDVGDRDPDAVDECTAVEAEPLDAVPVLGPPGVLDDEPDRASLSAACGHRAGDTSLRN